MTKPKRGTLTTMHTELDQNDTDLGRVISTILRHDAKVTSYKIALIRSINDVALSFPDLPAYAGSVAIPIRFLAEFWIAYYWPFVDPEHPIRQGNRRQTNAGYTSDMEFRRSLTELRVAWECAAGVRSTPAEGFTVMNDLRLVRKREALPPSVVAAYRKAVRAISRSIEYPIRYAGPRGEEWSVFPRPETLKDVREQIVSVPGAGAEDLCLMVPTKLWRSFRALSLWVEALCLHEWCLYTELVRQDSDTRTDRGEIYRLLTERPGNRQALTWERNHINILLLEGYRFTCPWTDRQITKPDEYDLDHLVPVSVYPLNELWNLVPSDRHFNQHVKRERLPSEEALLRAEPLFGRTYATYGVYKPLATALRQDVASRFPPPANGGLLDASDLAHLVHRFISQIAESRNLARFSSSR